MPKPTVSRSTVSKPPKMSSAQLARKASGHLLAAARHPHIASKQLSKAAGYQLAAANAMKKGR